jgi:hypothetical protein
VYFRIRFSFPFRLVSKGFASTSTFIRKSVYPYEVGRCRCSRSLQISLYRRLSHKSVTDEAILGECNGGTAKGRTRWSGLGRLALFQRVKKGLDAFRRPAVEVGGEGCAAPAVLFEGLMGLSQLLEANHSALIKIFSTGIIY